MEIHRPSASAMRVPSRSPALEIRPNTSKGVSQTSTTSSHSRAPMSIPGARIDEPPPPLPPPRYNEELDRGIDVSWSWQNNHEAHSGKRQLAPIKPGSSMFGGYMHPRGDTRRSSDVDEMDLDDWDHRGSTVSTIRSPSQADMAAGTTIPSLVRRPPSPASSNQRLQGERPLAQENLNRSSQAYDQRVLSKIGKPNSPPQHLRSESAETSRLAQKLSLQTRDPRSQRLAGNELSPSALLDPVSRWITGPTATSLSPGARQGWRGSNMDARSPSNDSTATSLILDPELFMPERNSGKPYASNHGNDDTFSATQGMKRRALSPPPEMARDDKPPAYPTELFQKISAPSSARSSAYRPSPTYGSASSAASSNRQNSYTSSFAPSLTGSSLTSISSYERQSPSDPSQPHQYLTSAHLVSSPATSIAPTRKPPVQNASTDSTAISRKMSIQTAVNEPGSVPATRIGSFYICECCPKKPKKFDSETELRSHQMEKQYSCQYCNNRFKNKNEAERHQNSLHLRRHSWSCAAIPSYQAAFHPSTAAQSQGLNVPLQDACGYCGEEFPNHPQPDWERRIDHLTNVHKFGECNQAKKFFRADHFRQHLKHSHAGQSGKWTNMLETVCLREELPADVTGLSPTGSDSSQSRGPSSLPGPMPMGGATINEAQEDF